MSRFRFAYGSWLPYVVFGSVSVVAACGGASDSSLFGSKPGVSPSGGTGGATSVSGAGGTSLATGGFGGATDIGSGGEATLGSGGTEEQDSGVIHGGGAGGLGGQGGQASGGAENAGGANGSGGEAGVAWARCNSDSDCVGGRVCTKSAQSVIVSGRPGGCVHHCGLTTAQCDPPPSVGTVSCTQLLVASFCTINCASGNLCPAGMDCLSGICYYSN